MRTSQKVTTRADPSRGPRAADIAWSMVWVEAHSSLWPVNKGSKLPVSSLDHQHPRTHTYTHARVYTHRYTHAHVYTHTGTHTHIHAHTQAVPQFRSGEEWESAHKL